tara:strand:- start:23 stop:853 length:831 start_codon:yes stop_codon:yes gene_type:complete
MSLRVALLVLTAWADDASTPEEASRCSACCSIVAELERNLEIEKPRMNVDLRRTLAGKDAGKVVDWATSELRTLELLEGICPAMEHYGVTRVADGAYYQRHSVSGGSVHVSGSMTIGGDKYQHDRGFLRSYCDRVVEEHEEPLGEAIRAAGLVHLARKKRGGLDASGARAALGLSDDADENDAAAAYKRLARELHPDKGGDRERFLAVVDAYEALTGREHRPYGDLYRSVCVDVVGACASEEDVEASKRFFPRYDGSAKFPRAKKRRKRRRRRKEL